MKLKYIFGRLTAYVPIEGMMEDGDVAEWFPCEGEGFDIIFYDPKFANVKQALLHEEVHALVNRLCLHQTDLSSDLEEIICEAFSVFVDENYELKEKT